MFENRVLRKTFGSKRDEVAGERKGVHNGQLYHLHSSPYIIRVSKPRRIGWAWLVRRMGERKGAYRGLVGET